MARLRPLYPTARELQVSDKEKQAARTAAGAQGTGAAWGAGIGTAAGAGIGALGLLVPGLAAATIPAGAAAGGALGGAIGSSVGGAVAEDAEDSAGASAMGRDRRVTEAELRKRALNAFLKRGG
jgi:hypothetical protein